MFLKTNSGTAYIHNFDSLDSEKEIVVFTKMDLINVNSEIKISEIRKKFNSDLFFISSYNNEGIDKLMNFLFKFNDFLND